MPDALGVMWRWEVRSYLGTSCFVRYRGPWDVAPEETSRIVEPMLARAALSAAADTMDTHELESMSATLNRQRPWCPGRARSKDELLSGLLEAIDTGELVALQVDPPRPPTIIPREEPDLPAPRMPQATSLRPPKDRYLRLRLMGGGEPRSNKAYVLKLDDGTILKGKTSGDGVLVEKLTPTVRRAKLRLESAGLGVDESSLDLDALAPPSGLSGVQQRLRNEGLLERVTGSLDEATRAALSVYQERHKVAVSGEADRDTQAKLEETHGS